MTAEELDTLTAAHMRYIRKHGTARDAYNKPFTSDELLPIARAYDRNGYRARPLSAVNTLRLLRYVMRLLVEIRLLRERVASLDEKAGGMVDKGNRNG